MAERANRLETNRPGPFYVDSECIDCDLCREIAPENFERDEEEGNSFVYKQPETDEEREQCEEARDSCPVEAIGNDGEEG
jgi:ferredoxin